MTKRDYTAATNAVRLRVMIDCGQEVELTGPDEDRLAAAMAVITNCGPRQCGGRRAEQREVTKDRQKLRGSGRLPILLGMVMGRLNSDPANGASVAWGTPSTGTTDVVASWSKQVDANVLAYDTSR